MGVSSSRPPFLDSRLERLCVYCGGLPETKDHVPSRILLDDPIPGNVPTVKSCHSCNNSFSESEEYVATLLECLVNGSINPEDLQRSKIRRVLENNSRLASDIGNGFRRMGNGTLVSEYDRERVRTVILKLARGHLAFEHSNPKWGEPSSWSVFPLAELSWNELEEFENTPRDRPSVLPEIGSRAFQRTFTDGKSLFSSPWIIVQQGRYRYSVEIAPICRVRMVFSEYLGSEAIWDQDSNGPSDD